MVGVLVVERDKRSGQINFRIGDRKRPNAVVGHRNLLSGLFYSVYFHHDIRTGRAVRRSLAETPLTFY